MGRDTVYSFNLGVSSWHHLTTSVRWLEDCFQTLYVTVRFDSESIQGVFDLAIAVIVEKTADIEMTLDWAWRMALARSEGLFVLFAQVGPEEAVCDLDPTAVENGEKNQLWVAVATKVRRWYIDALDDPETSDLVIRKVIAPHPHRAVLAELERAEPSFIIASAERSKRNDDRTLSMKLARRTRFPIFLCNGGTSEAPKRILFPLFETEFIDSSVRELAPIIGADSARYTVLAVVPTAVEFGEDVGRKSISRALKTMGVDSAGQLKTKVVISDDLDDAIAMTAADHDALLMAVPGPSTMYRSLFGRLRERIKKRDDAFPFIVFRQRKSWHQRLLPILDRWLNLWVPQTERAARIDVYESLQSGSRWGFDFMMLIALSTAIAALGLLQGSPAVVIGAMLVAPLMTPMLGAGLALLQGNPRLLKESTKSILLGFLLALALGLLVGLLSPIKVLTSEMAARGAPNLLDLGVALISGFAAAYAYARTHLSAALPGVAIAAALVPPIATAGLCFALGEFQVGAGAVLLFGTNVLAIVVGATCAFYSFGLRGRDDLRSWASRFILLLVFATLLLAVPLSSFLWGIAERPNAGLSGQLKQMVERSGYELGALEKRGDWVVLKVRGDARFPPEAVTQIESALREANQRSLKLRVITELVTIGGQ